jgi:deoxyribonuclease-4
MEKLFFGTSGIPHQSKKQDSRDGIRCIAELGLDAMELEFVQGVRIKEEMADEVDEVRKELDVKLTAHGPYWINLNAVEDYKVINSRNHILNSARIGKRCGAWSVVFHAAFYLKQPAEKVYKRVKKEMKGLVKTLRDEGCELWLRPETTGKGSQFGTLDELIRLSEDVEGVLPCTDFSHMHARGNGGLEYDDYTTMLAKLENRLGRNALDNMHIHMSGIEYTEKGEKKHLPIKDSDFEYNDVLKALKDFDAKGIVVCESPELEYDAIKLKNAFGAML